MILRYHSKFEKDIRGIKDKKLKLMLLEKIEVLKESVRIEEVAGVKKLSGHPKAYRIRIGNYRLGFFLEGPDTVRLQRFVKRSDIYKNFP